MSTAKRELEELRRIREAERLRLEQERLIEEEKATIKAKRQAFMAKANVFTQKKGPTMEEVKTSVQKASAQRKFTRKLNRTLAADPSKNAVAVELGMKGSDQELYGRDMDGTEWEMVIQVGERPYYWNKITNETTYDRPEEMDQKITNKPPPPPPPPRKMLLPGLTEGVKLNNSTNNQIVDHQGGQDEEETEDVIKDTHGAEENLNDYEYANLVYNSWKYVYENEATPYYWNIVTNATTFEAPEYFELFASTDGHEGDNKANSHGQYHEGDGHTVTWQEYSDEMGGIFYSNLSTGEVKSQRPEGTLVIACEGEDGHEENWQECHGGLTLDELKSLNSNTMDEGTDINEVVYYQNVVTGRKSLVKPNGYVMIISSTE